MQELDLARLGMGVKIEKKSVKPSSLKYILIGDVFNHCSAVAKSNFVMKVIEFESALKKSRFAECIERRNNSWRSISK